MNIKPWAIIASRGAKSYTYSSHARRTEAEQQIAWLRRSMPQITFSVMWQG